MDKQQRRAEKNALPIRQYTLMKHFGTKIPEQAVEAWLETLYGLTGERPVGNNGMAVVRVDDEMYGQFGVTVSKSEHTITIAGPLSQATVDQLRSGLREREYPIIVIECSWEEQTVH